MTNFSPFHNRFLIAAALVLSAAFNALAATNTKQAITMDLNVDGPPVCASASSGDVDVTLQVINIPTGVSVSLRRSNHPLPQEVTPPGARVVETTKTFTYTADPNTYDVFALIQTTADGKEKSRITWTCGFDDTVSLSVGALFTEIPYRTYKAENVPTASGVQNQLVVGDNGRWTPQGVGLLNVKLFHLDSAHQWGIYASTGPVFKFGGTPGVSSFGWFAGPSLMIRNQLALTAGMHVGEFADYPAGFTNNSPVPANFGTPTPVNRWTARFAFSITYRTTSVKKSQANGSSTTKPTMTGGGGNLASPATSNE
jgi:hypothetical protein